MCDRFGRCYSLSEMKNSAKKIHQDFALSWKASESELLFENQMFTNDWETKFYNFRENINEKDIEDARKICGNVS